ncbi:MAG: DMT family transporter [Streptosporangiales bacterium]
MIIVAVLGALGAAFFNALAGYLQYGASKQVAGRAALHMRLLVDLGRNRRWLAGAGSDITAFGFQILALAFGALIFVQPLLVTSLLIIVAMRGVRNRKLPPVVTWVAALLCCGGLSGFLLVAHPRPGTPASPVPPEFPPLALVATLAAVLLGCLAFAARSSGNRRAVALAIGAGMLYGLTAGLAKIITSQLDLGVAEPFQHWMIYAAVVLGITGAQLNQTAFQAGALAAPIAVITVIDPLTSIAVGLGWLGERVDVSAVSLIVEALSLACMIVGIALLSRETPQVSREPEHSHWRTGRSLTAPSPNAGGQDGSGVTDDTEAARRSWWQQLLRPRRSSTGRHPRDLVRAAVAAAIATLCTLAVMQGGVNPVESAIAEQLRRLPNWQVAWHAIILLGSLGAIATIGAILLFLGRWRMALTSAAAGALASVIAGLVSAVTGARTLHAVASSAANPVEPAMAFPSGHVAVAAALAAAVAPYLGRPARNSTWIGVLAVCVAEIVLGRHLPLGVLGGAFLGVAVASALHVLFGAPGRRTSEGVVLEALEAAGIGVKRIAPSAARWWGPQRFDVHTSAGEALEVKVVHRMHRRLGLWYKLRRLLGSFGTEVDARLASPWHEADHEALVTLMAERAGVRTPRMVLVSGLEHGHAIVVREAVSGRHPTHCGDQPPGAWVDDLWRQVNMLAKAGIAHHDLQCETLRIDTENRVWILDFTFAEGGATPEHRAQDVAEVLVFLVPLVGVEAAVESAARNVDEETLRRALPYLHPLALPPRVRAQLQAERPVLAEVRETLAEQTETPPQSRGLPVRPSTVVSLCLFGAAVYVLLPQITTIGTVVDELRHAYPGPVAAAVLASLLVFPVSALAVHGASPRPLAFWRTTAVQIAATFAGRITPGGLGLVGVNYVYLERTGMGRSGAVGAIALNRAAGVVVSGAGIGIGVLLLGSSPTLGQVPLPPLWSLLAGIAALMVIAGVVVSYPPGQRLLRWGADIVRELSGTLRQPARAAQLFGGATGYLAVNALGLVASLAAFGPEFSVPTVVAVYLIGGTLGSAAPTPGGLGAVEAALVAGLTATGTTSSTAVAGVLTFRLATFWLPVAIGPFVSRWLQHREVI